MSQKVTLRSKVNAGPKNTTLEEDERHFPPGHLSAVQMRYGMALGAYEAQQHEENVKNQAKYTNLASLGREEKLKALKDKNLDPWKIAGPNGEHAYDGLMNVLQRWKDLATSPEAKKLSPERRDKMAMTYYKGMILPFYEMMHKDAPPPELWKQMAYTKATEWDMDGAYKSHWRQGLYAGFKDYENLGKFALTTLGGIHETLFDLGAGLLNTATESYSNANMSRDFVSVLQGLYKQVNEKGVYGTLQSRMRENPLWTWAHDEVFDKASKTDAFWEDVNPNENWRQSATSVAVEIATQLPLFKGLGAANTSVAGTVGKIIGGTEMGANLTKALGASKIGQVALRMLTYGTEGAAYGYVTRDDSDKNKAWQDGITAAVLGTVFHYGGEKLRLSNLLKGDAKTQYNDIVENLELSKKNQKIGDADSLEPELIKTSSHDLAAGGLPTQLSMFRSALEFVKATDGMSRSDYREIIKRNLNSDNASWNHVFQYSNYIRSLMRGKHWGELTDEDHKFIFSRLEHIMQQGGDRMNENVPEVQAAGGQQAVKNMQGNKNGQAQIQKLAAQLEAQERESGLPARAKNDYIKAAEISLAKTNAKAAAASAAKRATQPVAEARDVQTRRVRAEKGAQPFEPAVESPGYLRARTKYWQNKKGEPGVSYSINREWKSYMQNNLKKAGLKWDSKAIQGWIKGLSPEDFSKDLHDFFFPKELKEAGVFFEHEANREGNQDPNFLAFMYNFKDQMPKEYADRLREELADTVKFEKAFNPAVDEETQMRYYAEAMYNHVNDFLQSGRVPKETNVFRSTLSDLRNPTIYQQELHNEATAKEIDIIHSMFPKNVDARNMALKTHARLARARAAAFKAGRQTERRELSEQMYDQVFSSRERWNF